VKLSGTPSFTLFNARNANTDAGYTSIALSGSAIRVQGYSTIYRQTSLVLRDYSAWCHIVVSIDTTQSNGSDRIKLYVNGVIASSFSTSNDPAQNADLQVSNTSQHRIGDDQGASYFDGYLADIHFIDGQALDPTSFGEFSATTGVWVPKAYTGTYGTNGFHLEFADNSAATATTLGKDTSGNNNNWTPNNLTVALSNSITFPNSGSPTAVDYLVIGGGGGGGGFAYAGGGGAGGYLTGSTAVTAGAAYVVTVGAGGSGGVSTQDGFNGSNSVFGALTAIGGGGGGGFNAGRDGKNGGSGGGSNYQSNSPGLGTAGQGNNGGSGFNGGGGGGGGAGAAGSGSSGLNGGAGGAGLSSSITGTAVTRAGGGGGGAIDPSGASGAAGSGGGGIGGNGSGSVDGGNGVANTGGGGGGAAYLGSKNGGNGGSGVVIIRYPDTFADLGTIGGGLTYTRTTTGGYKIYTFTASSTAVPEAGIDSLVDVPVNGSEVDTGAGGQVRGNYCTWNPLEKDATTVLSNGNLNAASIPNAAWLGATFAAASGKWYYEITTVTGQFLMLGVADYAVAQNSKKEYTNTGTYYYYGNNGQLRVNGVNTAFPDSGTYAFANNDVIGVAFDCDAGTVNFYRNGSKVGGASNSITGLSGKLLGPALSAASGSQECIINAGQRPFAYTAPSGFKALNTANLPAPVVTKPSTVMDVALYTGNGSTQTISGLGFSPDLVWIKSRSGAYTHTVADTVRGIGSLGAYLRLFTNSTSAEQDDAYDVTSISSTGFTLANGDYANRSATTYAAWCWDAGSSTVTNTQGSITASLRANTSSGFSVVSFTSPSSGTFTVGHGLGVAPSLIILKDRGQSGSWSVYHSAVTSKDEYLLLNSTAAKGTSSNYWGTAAPTSTVFGANAGVSVQVSDPCIAYCFTPVAGYSSAFSFTGNGSSDGPMVHLGFRPRLLIIKRTDAAYGWYMYDTARDAYNIAGKELLANSSDAEVSDSDIDILSNGFKPRRSSLAFNASGGTFIGYAWAESPFQYARAR
jgi:hypothetical protein